DPQECPWRGWLHHAGNSAEAEGSAGGVGAQRRREQRKTRLHVRLGTEADERCAVGCYSMRVRCSRQGSVPALSGLIARGRQIWFGTGRPLFSSWRLTVRQLSREHV